MGVFINKLAQKPKGNGVKNNENPNKFNSIPSGIIGQANLPTGQRMTTGAIGQQQKPTTSTIMYGTDLLNQVNFRQKDKKDKKVKLKI